MKNSKNFNKTSFIFCENHKENRIYGIWARNN